MRKLNPPPRKESMLDRNGGGKAEGDSLATGGGARLKVPGPRNELLELLRKEQENRRVASDDPRGNVAHEKSSHSMGSWDWSNINWKRWSHERVGGQHELYVPPRKRPWTLKPVKPKTAESDEQKSTETNIHTGRAKLLKHSESMLPLRGMRNSNREASKSTFSSEAGKRSPDGDFLGNHRMREMPSLTGKKTSSRIYAISKTMLITAADPAGDYSWSLPYPKTYEVLPNLLADAGDWGSFKMLMTDLLFLWRKLQSGNQVALLQLYEKSSLALFATGLRSERLQAFSDFFFEHLRHLENPNQLFILAASSRSEYIKQSLNDLLSKFEHFLEDLQKLLLQESARSPAVSPRRKHMSSENLTSKDKALMYKCMRLVNAKNRLHATQQSGLADCMPEAKRRQVFDNFNSLVQNIEILKSKLREEGLEAYISVTEELLGLNDSSRRPGGNDKFNFLECVNLWTEMDYAYVNLAMFIPPRVWSDPDKMNELEHSLCKQVAAAAHVDQNLVDLLHIKCDPSEEKKGMHGKALLKVLGLVTGLEVQIVGGRYWPGNDSMSKANLVVGIRLGPGRRKKESKAHQKLQRLARKLQEVHHFTASRPGEINPVNPKFINEMFQLMIYVPNQSLIVTVYEQDKGARTSIGEVMLKVDDILSECRNANGLSFQRSYGLVKAVTLKPIYFKNKQESDPTTMRQSEIILKFRYFTHGARSAPARMAELAMKEANNASSPLRAGCIVTGPAFEDASSSWETLRIYVCSNYHEMQPERAYLERFVFPALVCKCQLLKIHFKWVDLSGLGQPGTRDDVAKRIHAIHQSKIRSYDKMGRASESHLVLCLIGEKRGRLLEAKDVRNLRSAETVHGQYKWVEESAETGISVLEMEMRAAIFNAPERCDPIVCLRNPAFLNNDDLIKTVPLTVRARFMETNAANRTLMSNLRTAISDKKPHNVIRYKPTFHHFKPLMDKGHLYGPAGERLYGDSSGSPVHDTMPMSPSQISVFREDRPKSGQHRPRTVRPRTGQDRPQSADAHGVAQTDGLEATDGEICLGNLESFGLKVFEQIWDIISERYSYDRSHTRVSLYGEELKNQSECVKALFKRQCQVPGGTQENVLNKLNESTDFLNSDHGNIVYLIGPHGCGKSTLLARLIVMKDLVDVSDSLEDEQPDANREHKSLKSYVRTIINSYRLTSHPSGFGKQTPKNDHEVMPLKVWTRVRAKLAATLIFPNPGSEDQQRREVSMDDPANAEASVLAAFAQNAHIEDGDEDGLEAHEKILDAFEQADKPKKVDVMKLKRILESIHVLVGRRVPQAEIAFRIKLPHFIFFMKQEAHTTNHLLSHLCSSLLRQQDPQVPSWRRFEHLLRQTVSPPAISDREPEPVVLILDNINKEERDEIKRIVLAVHGRVRAIVSPDTSSLHQDDHFAYAGLRKSLTTLSVPMLGYKERQQIFDRLLGRVGPKKKPGNFAIITDRLNAASPLYLNTVAGYLSSCITINSQPENLSALGNNTVDIISNNFLPMLEDRFGRETVKNFAEVVLFDPMGHERRELQAMMQACGIELSENNLRLLMEAFRPFADTLSTMSEDHMAMTRTSMHEACQRRYNENGWDVEGDVTGEGALAATNELATIKEMARKQDSRIAQLGTMMTMEEPEDDDIEDEGEWFSQDDEPTEENQENISMIVDELELEFGQVSLLVNRELFFKWCVGDVPSSERDSTMDLRELMKMLRIKNILPTYVTKTMVAEIFKAVNLDQTHADSNQHELDFQEFMDCMQRIHREYVHFNETLHDEGKLKAALMLQSKHRGDKARRVVLRKKYQQHSSKFELGAFDECKIIQIQARARAKCERSRFLRKVKFNKSTGDKKRTFARFPPSIRGQKRSDKNIAQIQERLKVCFDSVVDAFVYVDLDGNGSISRMEFTTAMSRLMLTLDLKTTSKVAAVLAGSDSMIDCLEFLRAFAWHDVHNIEEELYEAKLQKSTIVARAKEKLVSVFGRTRSDEHSGPPTRTSSFELMYQRQMREKQERKERQKKVKIV